MEVTVIAPTEFWVLATACTVLIYYPTIREAVGIAALVDKH